MARLIFLILLGCGSDIAIITKQQAQDTSVVDQQPAAEPGIEPSTEPASEPGSEMTDLTIGFANIHFRQIACPACVGESGEFDITAELKLHYPTSGDYTEHLTPVGTCTTNVFNNYVSMQPLPSTQPASFSLVHLVIQWQADTRMSKPDRPPEAFHRQSASDVGSPSIRS